MAKYRAIATGDELINRMDSSEKQANCLQNPLAFVSKIYIICGLERVRFLNFKCNRFSEAVNVHSHSLVSSLVPLFLAETCEQAYDLRWNVIALLIT